jgi:hypothetical protein
MAVCGAIHNAEAQDFTSKSGVEYRLGLPAATPYAARANADCAAFS